MDVACARWRDRNWLLDGLGNFAEFDDDGDAQTRTHNAANQIESLTPEGGQPVTMLHDAAGNLLDDGVLKYTYDAWNRQVAVRRAADDRLVAEYAFDGRGRRVEKSVFDADEELLATTGYFHNHRWQVLEEHCLPAGEQEAARTEYVWSATYIDSPIARFWDETEDADFDDPGETLYYAWDANRNVTALVGLVEVAAQQFAWQPVERYVDDPYGRATVRDADWTVRPDGDDENPTPGDESAFGNEILYCVSVASAASWLFRRDAPGRLDDGAGGWGTAEGGGRSGYPYQLSSRPSRVCSMNSSRSERSMAAESRQLFLTIA